MPETIGLACLSVVETVERGPADPLAGVEGESGAAFCTCRAQIRQFHILAHSSQNTIKCVSVVTISSLLVYAVCIQMDTPRLLLGAEAPGTTP